MTCVEIGFEPVTGIAVPSPWWLCQSLSLSLSLLSPSHTHTITHFSPAGDSSIAPCRPAGWQNFKRAWRFKDRNPWGGIPPAWREKRGSLLSLSLFLYSCLSLTLSLFSLSSSVCLDACLSLSLSSHAFFTYLSFCLFLSFSYSLYFSPHISHALPHPSIDRMKKCFSLTHPEHRLVPTHYIFLSPFPFLSFSPWLPPSHSCLAVPI